MVEANAGLQGSVTNWGRLLTATGGLLKPSKCFYHLISYLWKQDGTWVYDGNKEDKALQLVIPLQMGTLQLLNIAGWIMPTKP